ARRRRCDRGRAPFRGDGRRHPRPAGASRVGRAAGRGGGGGRRERPEGRAGAAGVVRRVPGEGAAMSAVKFQGITPYLHYEDAAASLDWLARVLGFDEISRYVDDGGRGREDENRVGARTIRLSGRDCCHWGM